MEGILGIERRGKRLSFHPRLPSEWEGYTATLTLGGMQHRIKVVRVKAARSVSLEVNGTKVRGNSFEPKGSSEVVVKIPG